MLLRVSQAAVIIGVSEQRIYAAIKQKHLLPVEGVPYICLNEKDVLAFKEREKSKGGRPPKKRGRPRKNANT